MKDDIITSPQKSAGNTPSPQTSAPAAQLQGEPSDKVAVNENQQIPNQPTGINKQTAKPEPPQPQIPTKPKKKRNIVPIVVAVAIMIALSSIAVYAGLSKKENPDNTSGGNPIAQQPAQTFNSSQEIQETIDQIDNLPEDTDTSGDELTDQKLGL